MKTWVKKFLIKEWDSTAVRNLCASNFLMPIFTEFSFEKCSEFLVKRVLAVQVEKLSYSFPVMDSNRKFHCLCRNEFTSFQIFTGVFWLQKIAENANDKQISMENVFTKMKENTSKTLFCRYNLEKQISKYMRCIVSWLVNKAFISLLNSRNLNYANSIKFSS